MTRSSETYREQYGDASVEQRDEAIDEQIRRDRERRKVKRVTFGTDLQDRPTFIGLNEEGLGVYWERDLATMIEAHPEAELDQDVRIIAEYRGII